MMDTRTGEIIQWDDLLEQSKRGKFLTPMIIPPTEKQLIRKPPKVGRNEACPCGSGKKFKKCCLNKEMK